KLYKTHNDNMVNGIKDLCKMADLIVPNYTEACFLTGNDYRYDEDDELRTEEMAKSLLDLGCKNALLTGVHILENKLLSVLSSKQEAIRYYEDSLHFNFFGAGDMLASTVLGYILKGMQIKSAIRPALSFMQQVVRGSIVNNGLKFLDLKFEDKLKYLADESKLSG
ncbi:MAG: bifunctional hydroxymethylpyrimidine kinase/phosphomethylpyrimidine kinase, partial [Clostridia bacterium]|nr:bifunctional hydroxymethylpyrimidine kinase/phosphomethylpyrimidine kinase [Clostridia bacterium]